MDQPNLEVSLQAANPDANAQATKPEAEGGSTSATESSDPQGGGHGDGHGDDHGKDSSEPKKPGPFAKVKGLIADLVESLFSSDAPTRKTALLFFIGVIGVIVISIAGLKRISHDRAERALALKEHEAEEKHLKEIEESRLADLKPSENVLSLGRYMISLKSSGRTAADGPASADFELFVRCNEKEVREYVEARSVQVRSELTSALVGLSREDFLAVDGKRRTHKKILLILNQWLAREYSGAHIDEVWFSDLVVE